MVNKPDPPSIGDLHNVFMTDGVPLAVSAAQKAIAEAGIDLEQVVSFVHLPGPATLGAKGGICIINPGIYLKCVFF